MKNSVFEGELAKLEKINREQKILIQILSDAYYSSKKDGLNQNLLFNLISKSSLNAINPSLKVDSNEDKSDLERIRQLELQIQKQDEDYAKLEKQLKEYNEKAKEYEDELAQNEREKAQLLANFQNSSTNTSMNASNVSEHFKERERRVQELTNECNQARIKNEQAQKLSNEIQDELANSQRQVKYLEKQLNQSGNSQILNQDDEILLKQIAEQDKLIESLTNELTEANNTIAKLKRENQSIRDKLMANAGDSET